MSSPMIRATGELLEDIKVLKEYHKSKSNSELLHMLVSENLKVGHVKTGNGYAKEGAVVVGPTNKPVVISHVTKDRVVFSDHTCLVNGGSVCSSLTILASSVEEYDGGFFNE